MKLTLWALALLLSANQLHAALGETEPEIAKRYGKMTGTPMSRTNKDVMAFYEYKNYTVSVTFIDGQSQRETFTHKTKKTTPPTEPAPFTEQELQAILDENANGSKWNLMDDNATVKIWVLSTKTGFAGYYKEHPYFSIESRVMLEFEDAVKQLAEKQKQNGGVAQPLEPRPIIAPTATPPQNLKP